MVDKNDSLLREVEEELRHDQLKKLWTDYGTYLVAAVALFIGGVFVYQQLESRRIAAANAASAQFETARRLQADKKPTEADAAFTELAKSGPPGYAALATFQEAAADLKAGKSAEAASAFDAIAGDAKADSVLRDLARLQAAGLKLGTADWTEMQNRLTPLIDERNAFRAQARELLGLAAQSAGQAGEARKRFLQVMGDSKASQGLKDRVTGHLSALIAADLAKASLATSPAAAPEPDKK